MQHKRFNENLSHFQTVQKFQRQEAEVWNRRTKCTGRQSDKEQATELVRTSQKMSPDNQQNRNVKGVGRNLGQRQKLADQYQEKRPRIWWE